MLTNRIRIVMLIILITACAPVTEATPSGPVQGPPAPTEQVVPQSSCAGTGMIELKNGQSLPVLGDDGFTVIGKVSRVINDLVYTDNQDKELDRTTVELHDEWSMHMLLLATEDGGLQITYAYIICNSKIYFPNPNPDGSA